MFHISISILFVKVIVTTTMMKLMMIIMVMMMTATTSTIMTRAIGVKELRERWPQRAENHESSPGSLLYLASNRL